MQDARTPEEPQRLSKVVMAVRNCSRREAEQYIAEGWVRVDGQLVEEPQVRVTAAQRVEVDPQARLQPAVPVTLLLHKPAGMGTGEAQDLLGAATRWSGDVTGISRVKSHGLGLKTLLALPAPASGLTVFSQDGRIVRKLTEDAALVEQELLADVVGTLAPDGLARLGAGLKHEGKALPPARVSWQSEGRLRFAVKGIAPDWIPWMCAQVGLELTALRRIRIGRVPMAGLPAGQWRYLPPGDRF
ncbi:rRNA pseudouridine synthase [Ramlibacter monticola]|uniref:Dual-specificity RNA pseudouridine synthase RluF n=1 Tax=Ramlibacter monticola TaxID=1926872 RepID=A0A936Z4Z7_9BURK|nr:RNA pseudouridine synthase [Ramlibacter monticola]MBL0395270.1 RNA-binding protein [Ramlibacter monticola]